MVFVGAAIMPHGALPFDGDPDSSSRACQERHKKLPSDMKTKFSNLYQGMVAAAEAIAGMDPEIIVLHSPHGIKLTSSVGVHVNSTARGSAEWNGQWGEFKVDIELASKEAGTLVDHLKKDGIAAEGISCFSNFMCPLMWGEAIPSWFIMQALKKPVRFIVISQTFEPLPTAVAGVSDSHLGIGRSIAKFVAELDARVAVVISGDLSHVYHSDYPDELYQPAKGWTLSSNHEAAVGMERAFQGWIKSLDDFTLFNKSEDLPAASGVWNPDAGLPWLQKAAELQPSAYACGLIGFVLLHALLDEFTKTFTLSSSITACEAPTYYGLMAAVFKII